MTTLKQLLSFRPEASHCLPAAASRWTKSFRFANIYEHENSNYNYTGSLLNSNYYLGLVAAKGSRALGRFWR